MNIYKDEIAYVLLGINAMRIPQNIAMDLASTLAGCQATRFALQGNTVLTGRVMGWGPSLHRIGMAWAATPATMDADGIAAAFEPYMAIQRKRIALAASLGLDVEKQPDPNNLSFLVTDRLLLNWDNDLRAIAAQQIARLKQFSQPGLETATKNGNILLADARSFDHEDDADPRPRLLYANNTHWGEYDGRTATIRQALPLTVVLSMPGRRLGDIVDLGASEPKLAPLAERIIVDAYAKNESTIIITRPEWERVTPA